MIESVKVGFLYIEVHKLWGGLLDGYVQVIYGVVSFCFLCEV